MTRSSSSTSIHHHDKAYSVLVQINTDHNIEGRDALKAHVASVVENAMNPFNEHITRVEVHLGDEDGAAKDRKTGQNDKRCMMEARLQGYHPLAVTAHADTLHQSIDSAADKLARVVESTLRRLNDHKHHRDAPTPEEETPPEAQ
jgi:ribosome-associated translation inhibitor RaiA